MKFNHCLLFICVLVIGLVSTSCEGPMGPMGPEGPQGEQGPVGPAGSDGSIILAGQGAPDENTGKPGDFYLDLGTGNLFGPKMAEGWGAPFNLIGDEGPSGPQGPQGPEGPQGPPGEDGEDGKDGQDGKDGEQGPQGPEGPQGPSGEDGEDGQDGQDGDDGEDGSQIYAGNGPPDSGQGKKGDYYLDRDNYDLYGPKTGTGWGSPVNLQGPKGDQGPQGPEGPAGTTDHGMLSGLSADDHTQYLLADGVRNTTNGFAVTGTFNNGDIPIEGVGGSILMWYPGKGAFRAGFVNGTQWENANIGYSSVAMGSNTIASSTTSTAMGNGTTASGPHSTAMGAQTIAATNSSLSIGSGNLANTSDDNTLFVAGNGVSTNRSDALVLDFDGDLWLAGTLTEASDRRLKTGITPLRDGVLDNLSDIRPVRYRFKEGMGHPTDPQLGLIAQEVQVHFPELVSTGSNGNLSLSYSNFTAVLLKGIQEQQAEIEKQSILIKQLRLKTNRVDHLEARLAKLEQQRPAHTVELTGFADLSDTTISRSIPSILLLFICCLILWHRQVITRPTRS